MAIDGGERVSDGKKTVANLKFEWVCVKNATAYSTIRRKSMAGKEERCCFLMMQISHGQTLNFNHSEMRNH